MDLTQNGSATRPVFQLNSSAGCGSQICDLLPAACVYLQQNSIPKQQEWKLYCHSASRCKVISK